MATPQSQWIGYLSRGDLERAPFPFVVQAKSKVRVEIEAMADDERADTSTQADDNNHDDQQLVENEDTDNGPENSSSVDHARMASLFRGDSSSENLDPATNNSSHNEFSLLVVLQPDGVRHRVLVTKEFTVQALANQIANDLKLQAEFISFPDLEPAAGLAQSETTLAAMGIDSSETPSGGERVVVASVTRKLTSSDYVMPDVIQVQVFDDETQTYRTVAVEITKFEGRKPYLGGFRHRKTQQIFHHASCQVSSPFVILMINYNLHILNSIICVE
jgi:hypothetical protein